MLESLNASWGEFLIVLGGVEVAVSTFVKDAWQRALLFVGAGTAVVGAALTKLFE